MAPQRCGSQTVPTPQLTDFTATVVATEVSFGGPLFEVRYYVYFGHKISASSLYVCSDNSQALHHKCYHRLESPLSGLLAPGGRCSSL